MKVRPVSDARGFTLVELMIALLLTGMVAMLVFGAFRIATSTWERVTHRQEVAHDRYLVQTFVRRVLEQANDLRLRDVEAHMSVAMHGDERQLTFLTELPTRDGVAELFWCQFRLKETDALQHQLVMTTRVYTDGEVIDWLSPFEPTGKGITGEIIVDSEPQERILLDGVGALEFEYLSYDDSEQPVWLREWVDEPVLPHLIRMRVLPPETDNPDAGADSTLWTELLVSPTEYRYADKTLL